ncbi:multiple epidermal growth factor-like domains protein 10 [Ostrea edulis]|uniref:multiple epidermal growth factor-like domains protein 10 n=1 Tax=Ostrea edulis TaxID=37623 RepID=UPI0024AEEA9D|nr:multiple epidermal growth factor-like domains protein 10 [Ostrea edulis]
MHTIGTLTVCDTCVNAACNPSNGYCSKGCMTGYWGNTCKSQCSQQCVGNTCEQGNGTCTNECAEFRYGYTCEHQCGPRCSPRTCDRVTGACSDCNAGYHGLFCNKTCSPYCKSGTCDAHNGHCIGGCKTNWTGDICDRCDALHFGPTCSEECGVHCKGLLCNNSTGSCTDGCETGYYKDTCNVTCNTDCKNGCNRNSGNCDDGCIDGKFGMVCYNNCGPGCISKGCEQITGSCSCKRGWQGKRCMECSPTFYGVSCEEECSPHCYNGTCYVNNGSCIGGCASDYTGDKCAQRLYETSPEDHETAIGTGVGASAFVAIVVVAGVIIFRLRRKRDGIPEAQKDPSKESRITTELKNEDRQNHSLPDARLYVGERPTNMETQGIGLYETLDSADGENKTYENDLSGSYVNAKSVALVPRTNAGGSDDKGNMYMGIHESQRNEYPYDELDVQD